MRNNKKSNGKNNKKRNCKNTTNPKEKIIQALNGMPLLQAEEMLKEVQSELKTNACINMDVAEIEKIRKARRIGYKILEE